MPCVMKQIWGPLSTGKTIKRSRLNQINIVIWNEKGTMVVARVATINSATNEEATFPPYFDHIRPAFVATPLPKMVNSMVSTIV